MQKKGNPNLTFWLKNHSNLLCFVCWHLPFITFPNILQVLISITPHALFINGLMDHFGISSLLIYFVNLCGKIVYSFTLSFLLGSGSFHFSTVFLIIFFYKCNNVWLFFVKSLRFIRFLKGIPIIVALQWSILLL